MMLFWFSQAFAQSQGVFAYPLKGQSPAVEEQDRYYCPTWAIQKSGFDPGKSNPYDVYALDPKPYQPSQRHVLKGGARGAALGAVGGAIAGDAGKGAAAGVAMGGLVEGFQRRDERRQQATQQQAAVSQAANSQQGAYIRAVGACLEARGYSVK
jgi:Glycine-zipper domain